MSTISQIVLNQNPYPLKTRGLLSKPLLLLLKTLLYQHWKKDGNIYSDETDKANILNNFFRDQTLFNDQNARVPNISCYVNRFLSTLVIMPLEVESVLKSLPLGKAVRSDGINNRILREIAHELSYPLCSLINRSLRLGFFPDTVEPQWLEHLFCFCLFCCCCFFFVCFFFFSISEIFYF